MQVITGKSSGETYIVVNNNGVEKRLHIFVGDYKLCTGQEELMEFDLSSVMNAWNSSIRSGDTSVVSAVKQGHDKNEVSFLFKAVSTGMANITISSGSTVLESFAVVVQNHPLAYFERIAIGKPDSVFYLRPKRKIGYPDCSKSQFFKIFRFWENSLPACNLGVIPKIIFAVLVVKCEKVS